MGCQVICIYCPLAFILPRRGRNFTISVTLQLRQREETILTIWIILHDCRDTKSLLAVRDAVILYSEAIVFALKDHCRNDLLYFPNRNRNLPIYRILNPTIFIRIPTHFWSHKSHFSEHRAQKDYYTLLVFRFCLF